MHLVSRRRQLIRIDAAGIEASFVEGESIWTESSHKYEVEGIVRMGEQAGFQCAAQWVEPTAKFSTTLFMAGERAAPGR
jgi:uncharacterized SAM-dependent methyltransferase